MTRILQWNCRSLNTSVKLLRDYTVSKDIDIISLQEIWTPKDIGILKKGKYRTHMKLRKEDGTDIHGGVALLHKP